MPGEYAARKLEKDRNRFRWESGYYAEHMRRKQRKYDDPLEGAPQGAGIVIEKRGVEQKQPHSGIIKCVRVQLLKNGITVILASRAGLKCLDSIGRIELMITFTGGCSPSDAVIS